MEITNKSLSNLYEKIKALQTAVTTQLEEIHKEKLAIQSFKTDIINSLQCGYYIRDEEKIVISAPEIIIGNVDKNGILLGNNHASKVTLRANNINLEGVDTSEDGASGAIISRSPQIIQSAVNPGIDGFENEVKGRSQVISEAKSIYITSKKATDRCFTFKKRRSENGLTLMSESHINIQAATKNQGLKKVLIQEKKRLEEEIKVLDKNTQENETLIPQSMAMLNDLTKENASANKGERIPIRPFFDKIDQRHRKYNALAKNLSRTLAQWYSDKSQLYENRRLKSAIETEINKIKTDENFIKESTETSISLNSESIFINSIDGEHNIRENDEAVVAINAKKIKLTNHDKDAHLIDKGKITLASKDIKLDTATITKDNKKKLVDGGKFTVFSETMLFNSVSYTLKEEDSKLKRDQEERDLKGSFTVRTKNIELDTTSTERQPEKESSFVVNAKNVEIKAVKYKADDKKEEAQVQEGSSIVLLSEQVNIGRGKGDKDLKPKAVVCHTDKEITLRSKETVSIKKAEDSQILLEKDNLTLNPKDKIECAKEVTLKANLNMKDSELTVKNIKAEGADVKTSFKSPNINDAKGVVVVTNQQKQGVKLTDGEKLVAKVVAQLCGLNLTETDHVIEDLEDSI